MSTDKTEPPHKYSILKVPADGGTDYTILITQKKATERWVARLLCNGEA